jgi:hypothetical protein
MPKRRPTVQSVRTNKVDDPHTTRILFVFDPINIATVDGPTMEEAVYDIGLISIIKSNENDLNLTNADFIMGPLDTNENLTYFYCNVQPTPHAMVDDFFNPLVINELVTVKINYTEPSINDGDYVVTYSNT